MKRSLVVGVTGALFLGSSVAYGSCEGVWDEKNKIEPSEVLCALGEALDGLMLEGGWPRPGVQAPIQHGPSPSVSGGCLVSGNKSHCGPLNQAWYFPRPVPDGTGGVYVPGSPGPFLAVRSGGCLPPEEKHRLEPDLGGEGAEPPKGALPGCALPSAAVPPVLRLALFRGGGGGAMVLC